MEPITKPQIGKLHCLYKQLGIDSKELLYRYTNGRTDSTADLSKKEATTLITALSKDNEREHMRRLIFSVAYMAGIIWGDTEVDKKLNRVKLNQFLTTRGAVKKELDDMTLDELTKTHRQMQAVVKQNHRQNDNKAAKAATDKLLKELNITVTTTNTNHKKTTI